MRFHQIYNEANMKYSTLSRSKPMWDDFTAGFEIEIAVDESVKDDFDYEDYFSMRGEIFDRDSIFGENLDSLMDEYTPEDFIDFKDRYNKDDLPEDMREATKEEIEKFKSEDEEYDYKSDDWVFIFDEDDNEVIAVDFSDLDEIKNWFTNTADLIRDEYMEKLSELAHEQTDIKIEDMKSEVPEIAIVGEHVYSSLQQYLGNEYDIVIHDDYHSDDKSGDDFVIEPDQSIDPAGVEIVSPVFDDYDEFEEYLKDVLEMVRQEVAYYTNESTGLHINIGGFDSDKLDMTKLILFLGETKVSSEFGREISGMARQLIPSITKKINQFDEITPVKYETDIKPDLDNLIRQGLLKHYTINFEKLDKGYIEFRGMGGSDYEEKQDSIILNVKRMIRAINIASDPNAYKNEFFKKLYKLKGDKTNTFRKSGEPRTPARIDAMNFVKDISPYTDVKDLKSHVDLASMIVNDHIRKYDQIRKFMREKKPSEMFLDMKKRRKLVDVYNQLKKENIKSDENINININTVRQLIENNTEKFHPKVKDFFLKLFT